MKNKTCIIGTNFSLKDSVCDGGSKTLANYQPIFDATIITKFKEIGIKNFVIQAINEFDIENKTSEVAIAVGNNDFDLGIGTDFNGSTRRSAAGAGIIGFKPTYGLISRYGMYAVASGFDTVGIYAKDVKTIAEVVNILKGRDINDMNTWNSEDIDLLKNIDTDIKNKKLFYIKELTNAEFIKNNKINAKEVSIDSNLIKAIIPTHNIIMNSEMTTTLANLTGIPFGPSGKGKDADEMMINHRNRLASETKKRLVMGTFALSTETIDKFYINALRIRRLICDEFNKLFTEFDALISDGDEASLLLANIGGFPSITVHNGILITGAQKSDANILNIANKLDKDGE